MANVTIRGEDRDFKEGPNWFERVAIGAISVIAVLDIAKKMEGPTGLALRQQLFKSSKLHIKSIVSDNLKKSISGNLATGNDVSSGLNEFNKSINAKIESKVASAINNMAEIIMTPELKKSIKSKEGYFTEDATTDLIVPLDQNFDFIEDPKQHSFILDKDRIKTYKKRQETRDELISKNAKHKETLERLDSRRVELKRVLLDKKIDDSEKMRAIREYNYLKTRGHKSKRGKSQPEHNSRKFAMWNDPNHKYNRPTKDIIKSVVSGLNNSLVRLYDGEKGKGSYDLAIEELKKLSEDIKLKDRESYGLELINSYKRFRQFESQAKALKIGLSSSRIFLNNKLTLEEVSELSALLTNDVYDGLFDINNLSVNSNLYDLVTKAHLSLIGEDNGTYGEIYSEQLSKNIKYVKSNRKDKRYLKFKSTHNYNELSNIKMGSNDVVSSIDNNSKYLVYINKIKELVSSRVKEKVGGPEKEIAGVYMVSNTSGVGFTERIYEGYGFELDNVQKRKNLDGMEYIEFSFSKYVKKGEKNAKGLDMLSKHSEKVSIPIEEGKFLGSTTTSSKRFISVHANQKQAKNIVKYDGTEQLLLEFERMIGSNISEDAMLQLDDPSIFTRLMTTLQSGIEKYQLEYFNLVGDDTRASQVFSERDIADRKREIEKNHGGQNIKNAKTAMMNIKRIKQLKDSKENCFIVTFDIEAADLTSDSPGKSAEQGTGSIWQLMYTVRDKTGKIIEKKEMLSDQFIEEQFKIFGYDKLTNEEKINAIQGVIYNNIHAERYAKFRTKELDVEYTAAQHMMEIMDEIKQKKNKSSSVEIATTFHDMLVRYSQNGTVVLEGANHTSYDIQVLQTVLGRNNINSFGMFNKDTFVDLTSVHKVLSISNPHRSTNRVTDIMLNIGRKYNVNLSGLNNDDEKLSKIAKHFYDNNTHNVRDLLFGGDGYSTDIFSGKAHDAVFDTLLTSIIGLELYNDEDLQKDVYRQISEYKKYENRNRTNQVGKIKEQIDKIYADDMPKFRTLLSKFGLGRNANAEDLTELLLSKQIVKSNIRTLSLQSNNSIQKGKYDIESFAINRLLPFSTDDTSKNFHQRTRTSSFFTDTSSALNSNWLVSTKDLEESNRSIKNSMHSHILQERIKYKTPELNKNDVTLANFMSMKLNFFVDFSQSAKEGSFHLFKQAGDNSTFGNLYTPHTILAKLKEHSVVKDGKNKSYSKFVELHEALNNKLSGVSDTKEAKAILDSYFDNIKKNKSSSFAQTQYTSRELSAFLQSSSGTKFEFDGTVEILGADFIREKNGDDYHLAYIFGNVSTNTPSLLVNSSGVKSNITHTVVNEAISDGVRGQQSLLIAHKNYTGLTKEVALNKLLGNAVEILEDSSSSPDSRKKAKLAVDDIVAKLNVKETVATNIDGRIQFSGTGAQNRTATLNLSFNDIFDAYKILGHDTVWNKEKALIWYNHMASIAGKTTHKFEDLHKLSPKEIETLMENGRVSINTIFKDLLEDNKDNKDIYDPGMDDLEIKPNLFSIEVDRSHTINGQYTRGIAIKSYSNLTFYGAEAKSAIAQGIKIKNNVDDIVDLEFASENFKKAMSIHTKNRSKNDLLKTVNNFTRLISDKMQTDQLLNPDEINLIVDRQSVIDFKIKELKVKIEEFSKSGVKDTSQLEVQLRNLQKESAKLDSNYKRKVTSHNVAKIGKLARMKNNIGIVNLGISGPIHVDLRATISGALKASGLKEQAENTKYIDDFIKDLKVLGKNDDLFEIKDNSLTLKKLFFQLHEDSNNIVNRFDHTTNIGTYNKHYTNVRMMLESYLNYDGINNNENLSMAQRVFSQFFTSGINQKDSPYARSLNDNEVPGLYIKYGTSDNAILRAQDIIKQSGDTYSKDTFKKVLKNSGFDATDYTDTQLDLLYKQVKKVSETDALTTLVSSSTIFNNDDLNVAFESGKGDVKALKIKQAILKSDESVKNKYIQDAQKGLDYVYSDWTRFPIPSNGAAGVQATKVLAFSKEIQTLLNLNEDVAYLNGFIGAQLKADTDGDRIALMLQLAGTNEKMLGIEESSVKKARKLLDFEFISKKMSSFNDEKDRNVIVSHTGGQTLYYSEFIDQDTGKYQIRPISQTDVIESVAKKFKKIGDTLGKTNTGLNNIQHSLGSNVGAYASSSIGTFTNTIRENITNMMALRKMLPSGIIPEQYGITAGNLDAGIGGLFQLPIRASKHGETGLSEIMSYWKDPSRASDKDKELAMNDFILGYTDERIDKKQAKEIFEQTSIGITVAKNLNDRMGTGSNLNVSYNRSGANLLDLMDIQSRQDIEVEVAEGLAKSLNINFSREFIKNKNINIDMLYETLDSSVTGRYSSAENLAYFDRVDKISKNFKNSAIKKVTSGKASKVATATLGIGILSGMFGKERRESSNNSAFLSSTQISNSKELEMVSPSINNNTHIVLDDDEQFAKYKKAEGSGFLANLQNSLYLADTSKRMYNYQKSDLQDRRKYIGSFG